MIDPKIAGPKAQSMSNMGRMVGMMGILLILVSFVIGWYVANLNANYWIESKAVREAAKAGEFFVVTWRSIEIWRQWQSMLQFIGMGLLLFGILVQLVVIVKVLIVQATNMHELLAGKKE